jgi:hypothetical protein
VFRLIKRLPVFRLLLIAQLALLVRDHLRRLEPAERRRLWELVRRGPGMLPDERAELRALVAKIEPRVLAGAVAEKVSPVPLPSRLTGGGRGAETRTAETAPAESSAARG